MTDAETQLTNELLVFQSSFTLEITWFPIKWKRLASISKTSCNINAIKARVYAIAFDFNEIIAISRSLINNNQIQRSDEKSMIDISFKGFPSRICGCGEMYMCKVKLYCQRHHTTTDSNADWYQTTRKTHGRDCGDVLRWVKC